MKIGIHAFGNVKCIEWQLEHDHDGILGQDRLQKFSPRIDWANRQIDKYSSSRSVTIQWQKQVPLRLYPWT